MTLDLDKNQPVYLFLPNHLSMEEPWKTYLERDASFLKVRTQSESGIKVFLDSEAIEDLAFSLELRYSKLGSISEKLLTSSTPEE